MVRTVCCLVASVVLFLVHQEVRSEPPARTAAEDGKDNDAEPQQSADRDEDSQAGEGDDEGFDDGFDDDSLNKEAFEHKEVKKASAWSPSVGGFTRSDVALWSERFDAEPIAKLRQSLDLEMRWKFEFLRCIVQLHGEYDFATLVDRDRFDQPTLDAYQYKLNTREAFLEGQFGDFQIALGRLIEVWGAGDLFSPLDVANPRDLREPGTTDLDDIRLPVLGTRLSWTHGRHGFDLLLIHEHDTGYRPAPLSDFSPLRAIIDDDPTLGQFLQGKSLEYRSAQERFATDGQALMARWRWNGPSIDMTVLVGSLLDRQGVFGLSDDVDLTSANLSIDLKSPRYEMIGHTGTWVAGKWLFTWELSYEHGRHFNISEEPPFPTDDANVINGLLGVRFTGLSDVILSLEIQRSFLTTDLDSLLFDVEALNVGLLATYTTLSETLEISVALLMSGLEAQYGWLGRGEVGWRIQDGLRVGAGYISYHPGDELGLFYGLATHDRIFLGLRWDFQIL